MVYYISIVFFTFFPFSAVSEDGCTILLLRKKDCKGTMMDVASKRGSTLGCKLQNGVLKLDKNAMLEAQSAMHVCNVQKCLMLFVNSGNHIDYLTVTVDYDHNFFMHNVQEKLMSFFENYLAKMVFQKNISIKN